MRKSLILFAALFLAAPAQAALPLLGRAPAFTLTDSAGKPFRRSDLRGPWVAGFIFTHCSSQCPMMTSRVREAARRLPGLRFISFSVDPADTPAVLRAYAERTGSDWTFLTGKPGEVRRLSQKGFKLPAAGGDTIAHSQYLVLVDAQSGIRGYYDALDPAGFQRLLQDAPSLLPRP